MSNLAACVDIKQRANIENNNIFMRDIFLWNKTINSQYENPREEIVFCEFESEN